MSEFTQHLPDNELARVSDAIVKADLCNQQTLKALGTGISPKFFASLPDNDTALIKLKLHLNRLNKVAALRNGEVPLETYLANAESFSGDSDESVIFEKALEQIKLAPPVTIPDSAAIRAETMELTPEAVIAGKDQTLGIKFLQDALGATGSVCKVLVHRHIDDEPEFLDEEEQDPLLANGTGWLIAPGLLITNHHVIHARRSSEPAATPDDFTLQAENCTVLFDFFHNNLPTIKTKTTTGSLLAFDKALDFALLRLPDTAPKRSPFRLRPKNIRKDPLRALDRRVNVLQHPNGLPMRLGFRDNFVVLGSNDLLTYLTDTDYGSSGSPVCDDAWRVAAIHTGSRGISNQNLELRGVRIRRENTGTPIQTILKFLKEKHPTLHQEIIDAQTD